MVKFVSARCPLAPMLSLSYKRPHTSASSNKGWVNVKSSDSLLGVVCGQQRPEGIRGQRPLHVPVIIFGGIILDVGEGQRAFGACHGRCGSRQTRLE